MPFCEESFVVLFIVEKKNLQGFQHISVGTLCADCFPYKSNVKYLLVLTGCFFEQRGGDVNAADNTGQTALHWSAVRGHIPVAELLLKEGAHVDAADLYGYQVLFHAISLNFDIDCILLAWTNFKSIEIFEMSFLLVVVVFISSYHDMLLQ